ncbi:valacyclovir hydrolase [Episyrphus balteatus]|uniref:valacyclovir hydrolase n=1 Tax=Episyrphus balteatus TaxID=286459 RepID=UPI002485F624|nr:valacyclovir hydrolase [Episyrphus balteatus]
MIRVRLFQSAKSTLKILKRFSSNFTEQKINVDGVDINYVKTGNGSKGILLMPGAIGSAWTDFTPQIEKLPKLLPDYTIIAWDPPGYGKSIPPKRQFDLNFYHKDAECATSLMKILGYSNFSVLGWSDGGITAMIMAGTDRRLLDNMVIWGAGPYINEKEVKVLEDMRDVSTWSARMREPMEKLYGPERFREIWSEWVDAAIMFYDKRNGNYCKGELEKIVTPTLILHGVKDPMIAEEHIPYIRRRILGCRYYSFPQGKHNIHLRYADEFNKVVANFLLQKY